MTPDLQEAVSRIAAARRILVLGSSGSGKSHLTKRLCALLDLEAIHLDALFWRPGWQPTPQAEWRRRVAELVRRETWIMDGTYESTLDLRLEAAQAAIYIEDSRYLCLFRAWWRTLGAGHASPVESPLGQRLDLGLARYIWRFPARTRPQVEALIRDQRRDGDVVWLHGSRDTRRFVDALAESAR